MLITPKQLSEIYSISPRGVLHVGAHEGEESLAYTTQQWGHIYWVEANPILAKSLVTKLDKKNNTVIEAAVWNESGVSLKFNIASNGLSSSLLDFGTHQSDYPEVQFKQQIQVKTIRLDQILPMKCEANFLTIDVQGAELNAIIGLGRD